MKEEDRRDEFELLTRLKSGDEAAFRLIFTKHSGQIYRVAYHYLNQRDESLEIAQDVFMKLWVNHSKLIPELPLIPYLIKIAKNIIFNKAKRKLLERAYFQHLEFQPYDKAESLEDQLYYTEIKALVEDQVSQFPNKRKEIFTLSRNLGLSNREIATKLQLSERTVENQINKALKVLKEKLRVLGYMFILF